MSEGPPDSETAITNIDDVLAEETAHSEESPSRGGRRESALTLAEANVLAAQKRPTLVVLAGSAGSGKTSVYAAIYERLGRGPFAGWTFAGSRTLPGFEERCHLWRTASGRSAPMMRHTNRRSLPWLHLSLRMSGVERQSQELLFGDFDGEVFDEVLTGRVPATNLPYLRRADHVGLVIDGARVADPTQRSAEQQQLMHLLRELLVEGAIAHRDVLSLLITKFDLIESLTAVQRGVVEAWMDEVNSAVNAMAGNDVPLLRLAVRSESTKFPLGHGLETLLEVMALKPAVHSSHPAPFHAPASPLGRFRA